MSSVNYWQSQFVNKPVSSLTFLYVCQCTGRTCGFPIFVWNPYFLISLLRTCNNYGVIENSILLEHAWDDFLFLILFQKLYIYQLLFKIQSDQETCIKYSTVIWVQVIVSIYLFFGIVFERHYLKSFRLLFKFHKII